MLWMLTMITRAKEASVVVEANAAVDAADAMPVVVVETTEVREITAVAAVGAAEIMAVATAVAAEITAVSAMAAAEIMATEIKDEVMVDVAIPKKNKGEEGGPAKAGVAIRIKDDEAGEMNRRKIIPKNRRDNITLRFRR